MIPKDVIMINKIVIKKKRMSKNKLSYKDPKYGFSLRLPHWWKRFIVVKRKKRLIDAEYGVFSFSNTKEKYMKRCCLCKFSE